MTGAIAKRYARALLGVARERGQLEETAEELERTAVWLDDPELATVLSAPTLRAPARRALIEEITRSLELSDLTSNCLGLLAEMGRLGHFRSIARAYVAMVDEAAGRVRATIHSAQPLPQPSLAEVVAVLEKISAKRVVARTEIDAALIAGLMVDMEGRVYDGSVRTQLAHLARTMARDVVDD
jgi:F-type H+-transporting ATPase subunit delta